MKSPRDIKLHQDNVIVLDLFDELKKSVYADKMVLRVYSKKEELLKLIRLEHLSLIGFFDVTPNSNYVIGSFNCIRFDYTVNSRLKNQTIPFVLIHLPDMVEQHHDTHARRCKHLSREVSHFKITYSKMEYFQRKNRHIGLSHYSVNKLNRISSNNSPDYYYSQGQFYKKTFCQFLRK